MTLAVEGVGCAGCIRKIEGGLGKIPGVIDARLNFTQRRLAVDWREDEIGAADIVRALERIGYHAHPFAPERSRGRRQPPGQGAAALSRRRRLCGDERHVAVGLGVGGQSDMTPETRDLFHWLSALIALPAAAYAGRPFFQSAPGARCARAHLNMDVPISVGVTLALGLSLYETATHAAHAYFDSAIMLLFFLLCGRYLDLAMRRKTRMFAGNLASLKAEFAHRLDAKGEVVRVPASALQPGRPRAGASGRTHSG